MRKTALALVLAAFCLPLPVAAQSAGSSGDDTSAEVLAGFTKLVDRGEARRLFGLPLGTFWRRDGGLSLALYAAGAEDLQPVLAGAAAPFAEVSGEAITVVESGAVPAVDQALGGLAPEADLVVVVGPRPALRELAGVSGFNEAMLANFEVGSWPFMFHFTTDARRRGFMLLADDEPARAREASFILATVWGLGGVTLGPELTGLVSDSDSGPMLTPLGEDVFALFFHPDLEVGQPIAETLRRAETLTAR